MNTHGCSGRNISADLHMEHLNRVCKDAVAHLGANKTPGAIVRIGKVVGTISNTLNKVTGVSSVSGEHTRRSDSGDLKLVINELCKSNVFENIPERKHRSFPSIRSNMFEPSTQKQFNSWMTENFKKLHARTNFNK